MHKKYQTPYVSCLVVTALVSSFAGLIPIQTIANLTSIGILFALTMCSVAVMVLRIKRPQLHRPFRCPALFVVAPLAIIIFSYFIYALLLDTMTSFAVWLTLSVAGYFLYAYRNSPLRDKA